MYSLILIAAIAVTPPPPSGGTDQVVGLAYAPSSTMSGLAVALAGSANTSIYFATWKLSDTAVANALCVAASRSVAVHVVLDLTGGTGTIQHQLARQIAASGGTCWNAPFPQHVANNFMTADSDYSVQGNYYWSPSAVQIGSYLLSVSGTPTAATNITNFGNLIASGTIVAFAAPATARPIVLTAPPLEAPCVLDSTTVIKCGRRSLALLLDDLGKRNMHRVLRRYPRGLLEPPARKVDPHGLRQPQSVRARPRQIPGAKTPVVRRYASRGLS